MGKPQSRSLDEGEYLERGPLRAALTLAAIYEDTGLSVSEDNSQPR